MTNPFAIFKIKRDERWVFIVALLVFAALNALLIYSHWDAYTKPLLHGGSWTVFTNNFEMSGYDQLSWMTITEGRVDFKTIRHPLYVSFLYPMYWLNHWLMSWTGMNFATIMMGAFIIFCATYAAVFFYRVLLEILALSKKESCLLTAFLFSFAHVLVPCMVPDHFVFTLFLLMMTLYISGKCIIKNKTLKTWQGFVLTLFSGGMASTNVAKIYLAGLFVNKKKFFTPKYLIIAVILPVVILLGVQRIQYYTIEKPLAEKNEQVMKANEHKRNKKKDDAHQAWMNAHNMQRATNDTNSLLYLFDFKTPRIPTLIDNYFGEGFQLHEDHILGDELRSRPEFISYNFWGNYVVEAAIVLLFVIGIFFGVRHKFYLIVLSWFGLDFLLNIVCGFAINEVYIMTSGWAFIIPIGIGYMLKQLQNKYRNITFYLVLFLNVFLWIWNSRLIVSHLV